MSLPAVTRQTLLPLFIGIAVVFIIMFLTVSREDDSFIAPTNLHLFIGDASSPAALPDITGWMNRTDGPFPFTKGVMWIRADFDLPESQPPNGLSVFFSDHAASEFYWDKEKIGFNGRVSDSPALEKPGQIDTIVPVPLALQTAGKHTLLIRLSNQQQTRQPQYHFFWLFAGETPAVYRLINRYSLPSLAMGGLLFTLSLFSLYLYLLGRHETPYLFFSLLSLSILLLMFAEAWRSLFNYPYPMHDIRMNIVLGLSITSSLLLLWYVSAWFSLSRRLYVLLTLLWLGIVSSVCLFVTGYDTQSFFTFATGLGLSIIISLYFTIRAPGQGWPMMLGLLLFASPMLVNVYSYMDNYFFISFSTLIAVQLVYFILQMRQKEQRLHQQALTESRLKLELLNKQLQPHFILNTLTAVEEWIEEDPTTAARFVQALADEFHQLAAMAQKAAVPLQQEIDMCQAYLNVMGFRRDTRLQLAVSGTPRSALVPPGIILTLCENAISHNRYAQGEFTFTLCVNAIENKLLLAFEAPVIRRVSQGEAHSGIGNQYIQAHLDNQFGSDWALKESLSKHRWAVELTLPFIGQGNSVA